MWDWYKTFSNIITALKENGEERVLYTVRDDESPLEWLHEFIREENINRFTIVWEVIHTRLFSGSRHAELDGHPAKVAVEEIFYSAIENNCNEIFYLMLAYALPNFYRCLEVARNCGNFTILDYLSKYITPVSV